MTAAAALRLIEPLNSGNETPLEARARTLAARYAAAEASEILKHAILEEFSERIALVSSFGAESAVLLHLAAQVSPSIPVIFINTGKHFAQTLAYRKKLTHDLGLKDVRDIHPDTDDLTRSDPNGLLWQSNPDQCCTLRKVLPLERALVGFDAWITGRKQFHGGLRAGLPVFEASTRFIKVNPIVRWSAEDIAAYGEEHSLPAHPLVAQGFPSIGCWPCTHPAGPGEDARAGRWRGAAKTECGIHLLGARQPSA